MSVPVDSSAPEVVSELRQLVQASDLVENAHALAERQRRFVTSVTAWLMAGVAVLTALALGVGLLLPGVAALLAHLPHPGSSPDPPFVI